MNPTSTPPPWLRVERRPFAWWGEAFWVSDGEAEIAIPSNFGPRLMSFGRVGGRNLLRVPAAAPQPRERIKGGHRLWIAPERREVTWIADNDPVEISIHRSSISIRGAVEEATGLRKTMILVFDKPGGALCVTHLVQNNNPWTIRLSAWAVTQMAIRGTAIVRFPERGSHPENLLPTHPLVMWAYTDLSDPRWQWNYRHFLLRQDPGVTRPQKVGVFNSRPLLAYLLGEDLLVKRTTAVAGAEYADMGCSVEVFANADMVELETLGPLVNLEPGAELEHVEIWSLHSGIQASGFSDAKLDVIFRAAGVADD